MGAYPENPNTLEGSSTADVPNRGNGLRVASRGSPIPLSIFLASLPLSFGTLILTQIFKPSHPILM